MAKRSMASDKSTARRDLFGEHIEGMGALEDSRGGKRTLRTHAVVFKPAPEQMHAVNRMWTGIKAGR